MRLYDLKDFLTFDEVADYLTDKGVYEFDISQEYDYRKLETLLIELVRLGKITPVFYNSNNPVNITLYRYKDDNIITDDRFNFTTTLNGYFCIDKTTYEFILKNDVVVSQNQDFDDGVLILCQHVYSDDDLINEIEYYPYKITEKYYPNILNPEYRLPEDLSVGVCIRYQLFSDGICIIKKDELLYPIDQLNALFLQQQKDNLQQQIHTIDSQLDDKELSTRSQNTVGTIIAGLANLANIDLKSHYGDDSNKKIRQELLKLGFKANEKDGLPLSSETVAKWLKIADDLSK